MPLPFPFGTFNTIHTVPTSLPFASVFSCSHHIPSTQIHLYHDLPTNFHDRSGCLDSTFIPMFYVAAQWKYFSNICQFVVISLEISENLGFTISFNNLVNCISVHTHEHIHTIQFELTKCTCATSYTYSFDHAHTSACTLSIPHPFTLSGALAHNISHTQAYTSPNCLVKYQLIFTLTLYGT